MTSMPAAKPENSASLSEEVFLRETAMCRKLHGENGGRCHWGECSSCGVIPLLHKLCRKELLEDKQEVAEAKRQVFEV